MDGLAFFAAALTAEDRRPPPGLSDPAARRFAVYRNNVAVGLIRALETRFPAVLSLLGEEFFRAMARAFTLAHPPTSPLLMRFGDDLPAFLADFPPVADIPYLPDIALIEAARTRAYHAADRPRLAADAFAALAAGEAGAARLDLHPAVHVIRSPHPVWTILSMASGWEPAAAITHWQPQAVLVDRPHFDVVLRPLAAGDALFLAALGEGETLGAAAERAAAGAEGFDLPAALAHLVGESLVTRIHPATGGVS